MLGALSQFGPALQGKQGSEALRSRHHLCSIEGFLQPFDRAGFVQRGECPEFCVQGGLKFHCLLVDFTPRVS